MSSLKELCSGLPVDPLPPRRPRDESVPHAPVRTPNLSDDERRVSPHPDFSKPFPRSVFKKRPPFTLVNLA